MPVDYAKFDDVYDSDEDREKEREQKTREARAREYAARQEKARAANPAAAAAAAAPSAAATASVMHEMTAKQPAVGPKPMMSSMPDLDMSKMTKEQRDGFLDTYAKVFNKNRPKKADYKFPDTIEEQRVICEAADELRQRGNALFKNGETVEAAKLYEQAALKFADWYAECFATDEEKAMVHAVKLPAHLNLAACSYKLGNYEHAVVHSSQVIQHEASNSAATNAKAYFRRGASHVEMGNLPQATADLRRALELSPADQEVRKALGRLKERREAYVSQQRQMTKRMLDGAGHENDDLVQAVGGEEGEEGEDVAQIAAEMAAEELPTTEAADGEDVDLESKAAVLSAFGGGGGSRSSSAAAARSADAVRQSWAGSGTKELSMEERVTQVLATLDAQREAALGSGDERAAAALAEASSALADIDLSQANQEAELSWLRPRWAGVAALVGAMAIAASMVAARL